MTEPKTAAQWNAALCGSYTQVNNTPTHIIKNEWLAKEQLIRLIKQWRDRSKAANECADELAAVLRMNYPD